MSPDVMNCMQDLHNPQVLAAMTALCTASLQLLPLHGLRKDLAAHAHPSKQAFHGELQLHLKRHTGRVKVETDLYVILHSNDMEIHEPPSEAMTAQVLVARAVDSGISPPAGCSKHSLHYQYTRRTTAC